MAKYHLECARCGAILPDFGGWFAAGQKCPQCGSVHIEARYTTDWDRFDDGIRNGSG